MTALNNTLQPAGESNGPIDRRPPLTEFERALSKLRHEMGSQESGPKLEANQKHDTTRTLEELREEMSHQELARKLDEESRRDEVKRQEQMQGTASQLQAVAQMLLLHAELTHDTHFGPQLRDAQRLARALKTAASESGVGRSVVLHEEASNLLTRLQRDIPRIPLRRTATQLSMLVGRLRTNADFNADKQLRFYLDQGETLSSQLLTAFADDKPISTYEKLLAEAQECRLAIELGERIIQLRPKINVSIDRLRTIRADLSGMTTETARSAATKIDELIAELMNSAAGQRTPKQMESLLGRAEALLARERQLPIDHRKTLRYAAACRRLNRLGSFLHAILKATGKNASNSSPALLAECQSALKGAAADRECGNTRVVEESARRLQTSIETLLSARPDLQAVGFLNERWDLDVSPGRHAHMDTADRLRELKMLERLLPVTAPAKDAAGSLPPSERLRAECRRLIAEAERVLQAPIVSETACRKVNVAIDTFLARKDVPRPTTVIPDVAESPALLSKRLTDSETVMAALLAAASTRLPRESPSLRRLATAKAELERWRKGGSFAATTDFVDDIEEIVAKVRAEMRKQDVERAMTAFEKEAATLMAATEDASNGTLTNAGVSLVSRTPVYGYGRTGVRYVNRWDIVYRSTQFRDNAARYRPSFLLALRKRLRAESSATDAEDRNAREKAVMADAREAVMARLEQMRKLLDHHSQLADVRPPNATYQRLREALRSDATMVTELCGGFGQNDQELYDKTLAVRAARKALTAMSSSEAIDWMRAMSHNAGYFASDSRKAAQKGLFQGLGSALADKLDREQVDPRTEPEARWLALRLAVLFRTMSTDVRTVPSLSGTLASKRGTTFSFDSVVSFERFDNRLSNTALSDRLARRAVDFDSLSLRHWETQSGKIHPLRTLVNGKREAVRAAYRKRIRSLQTDLRRAIEENPQVRRMIGLLDGDPGTVEGLCAQYTVARQIEALLAGRGGGSVSQKDVQADLRAAFARPTAEEMAKSFDAFLNGGRWSAVPSDAAVQQAIGGLPLTVAQREGRRLLSAIRGHGWAISDRTAGYIVSGSKVAGMIAAGVAVGWATAGAGLGIVAAALAEGVTITAFHALVEGKGFDGGADGFLRTYGLDVILNSATSGTGRLLHAGKTAIQLRAAGRLAETGGTAAVFRAGIRRHGLRTLAELSHDLTPLNRIVGTAAESLAFGGASAILHTAAGQGTLSENLIRGALFAGIPLALEARAALRLAAVNARKARALDSLTAKLGAEGESLRRTCSVAGVKPEDAAAARTLADLERLFSAVPPEQQADIRKAWMAFRSSVRELEGQLQSLGVMGEPASGKVVAAEATTTPPPALKNPHREQAKVDVDAALEKAGFRSREQARSVLEVAAQSPQQFLRGRLAEGEDFVRKTLDRVPAGEPGLSVRTYEDGRNTWREVAYRDPSGKPVAAGLLLLTEDGWKINVLVADKAQGVLARKAAVQICDRIFKMRVYEIVGTLSPDGARLYHRMMRRQAERLPQEVRDILLPRPTAKAIESHHDLESLLAQRLVTQAEVAEALADDTLVARLFSSLLREEVKLARLTAMAKQRLPNSDSLTPEQKLAGLLGLEALTVEQKQAILRAHLLGIERGSRAGTQAELGAGILTAKVRILGKDFTRTQRDTILRDVQLAGLEGRFPIEGQTLLIVQPVISGQGTTMPPGQYRFRLLEGRLSLVGNEEMFRAPSCAFPFFLPGEQVRWQGQTYMLVVQNGKVLLRRGAEWIEPNAAVLKNIQPIPAEGRAARLPASATVTSPSPPKEVAELPWQQGDFVRLKQPIYIDPEGNIVSPVLDVHVLELSPGYYPIQKQGDAVYIVSVGQNRKHAVDPKQLSTVSSPVRNIQEEMITQAMKDMNIGWKLHLNFDPKNATTVADVQQCLQAMEKAKMIRGFKIGQSSGQSGKEATVYIGAYDDACKAAQELTQKVGKRLLPHEPHFDSTRDDRAFVYTTDRKPLVVGRFHSANADTKGFYELTRYGKNGIPLLRRHAGKATITQKELDAADAYLTLLYGSFYKGKGSN